MIRTHFVWKKNNFLQYADSRQESHKKWCYPHVGRKNNMAYHSGNCLYRMIQKFSDKAKLWLIYVSSSYFFPINISSLPIMLYVDWSQFPFIWKLLNHTIQTWFDSVSMKHISLTERLGLEQPRGSRGSVRDIKNGDPAILAMKV